MANGKRQTHKFSLLQSSIALALSLSFTALVVAEEGEFIGTIELGESKRQVQTDTARALTVIDQDEINDRQASTIAELIDSVPGVTLVNGSTPSGSGINIRGFGANGTYGTDQKVAVIVDGATTGAEELYRIGNQLFTDPYLFKRIEVSRGTIGSFEYGSGIIGGLVKLETIDASDMTGGENGVKTRLTGGIYSNESGRNGSATVAWQPSEGFEFLANYSYREQDHQEDGAGNEIGNSEFDLPSYLLKAKFAFTDEHTLTLSYTDTSSSDRDVPYDSFQTTSGRFGNVDKDIDSQTASLLFNYNPVNNDFINLDIALNYANQEIDSTSVGGPSSLNDADHQYETAKFSVKNTAFIDNGFITHDLRFGVEFIGKDRLTAYSAPGGSDDRYALFVVDNIEFADGWTFSPALRYEESDIESDPEAEAKYGRDLSFTNDALMGGAGLKYEFKNGFSAFASYARTESLPILDDLDNMTRNVDKVLQYMQQPEVSKTKELGFSFDKIGLFGDGDKLALKVNYYRTEIDDITSYSADSIELDGFEIEGSLAFTNGLYIDMNANIVAGEKDTTTHGTIDWQNTPADSISASLGKRFDNFADVSLEVIHNADESRSELIRGHSGATLTQGNYDSFTVANVRATVTPQSLPNTEFRFSIENMTNEEYTPVLATRQSPGRNFKLTVSHLF